jgi:DnaK suppressor protein
MEPAMFDDDEIAHFKQRLLTAQQTLQGLKDAGDDAARTVKLDQTSVGRLSRMDALQEQAMSQERLRRRAIELARISAALKRMESGDYGYCVLCGEAIASGRLELDPATPTCIECAGKARA